MARDGKRKASKKRHSLAWRWADYWLPVANGKGMLLLSVLFVALYFQTLSFGFVFDDLLEVRDNRVLRGPVLDGLTMTQHDHQGTVKSDYRVAVHDSYRPLRYLSYQFDSKLFGLSAGAMHAHNVALGVISVWLVWWLLKLLAIERRVAFGITALFALHPVQVESVAYISARSDLHAGLFALLTLISTLKASKKQSTLWTAYALLSFLCCLASKEAYVFFPLISLMALLSRGPVGKAAYALGAQVGAVVLWLTVRAQMVETSGETRLLFALEQSGAILRNFIVAFLWPFDSTVMRKVTWGAPWLEAMLFALAGAVALFAWWKTRSKRWGETLLSLLWYVLLIGPSILAAAIFRTLYDHYLYLPLLGLLGLIASAVALSWRGRGTLGPLVTGVACIWGVAMVLWTPILIPSWQSQATLAQAAVDRSPDVGRSWVWYGDAQAKKGGCDLAWPAYQRAVSVDPDYAPGWNNLSVCLLRAGKIEQALKHAKQAISLDPSHAKARVNAGYAAEALGRNEDACTHFRSATKLIPGYGSAMDGLKRTCPR